MQDQLLPRERVLAIQEALAGFIYEQVVLRMVNSTMMDIILIQVVNIA
jgi:hypothetical protein